MKLQPLSRQSRLALSLAVGLSFCLPVAAPAATLSVSPSTISNSFAGYITLTIGGLTNGETVVVQKYADANTNGIIDAVDFLFQQFQLKDGQASIIGGVTNFNVPGDTDSIGGQITARLMFPSSDFSQNFIGKYAFKLSSPVGHFTPITNLFTITNFPYSQTITGSVVNSGTNVPNAAIILFPAPRPGHNGPGNPLGGVVANNSGNYSIKAPAGSYVLLPFKSNFVADFATAPVVALGSGATITTNLTLTNATQSISGKVADTADNSIALPGLLLHGEANGLIAIGFSDTNGNFTMPVRSGLWGLGSEGLATFGYLGFDSDNYSVDTTTGSVSGLVVAYPKATAQFYGSVRDGQDRPLAGVSVSSADENYYNSQNVLTDTNGNYVAGALSSGTWSVQLEDGNNSGFTNYVFSQGLYNTNLSVGQALLWNFTALLATNRITGHLQDNLGSPVSGVGVFAYATINGTDYQTSGSDTDGSGNYSLDVPNGTWYVGVNCCDDCDNGLGTNYCCPGSQMVNISNANGVANFTVVTSGTVAITTDSPLPDADVGSYYQIQFNASSCQNPFTWTNTPGSPGLPSGLNLNSSGTLSGIPDTQGSNYFSVRVTDNGSHVADKGFSLIVHPAALEVTTVSLPSGTNGTFYSNIVEAVGGQLPYGWSLAPGSASLPPNLSISTNGVISGTLATNGTFEFYVRVTDALLTTADQLLSLTINNPPLSPLQITNSSLPNGLEGAAYNAQLGATGGLMPYTWSLAPGSANLPANLSIGADGLISGTPITNGTFNFIVRVTDSVPVFTNRALGIIINPKPRLSALLVGNQFKLRLTGATGLNYTVQYSTRLTNPIWTSFLITNPSTSPITILDLNATNLTPYPTNLDPSATNPARFYRAIVGP